MKMGKIKSGEALSLDKSKQKSFAKQTKSITKKLKKGKITPEELKEKRTESAKSRGLIYLGHIPHGFYEEEIESYFSQFGKVTNVKVCRSSKTGKSKGYGFVEFLNAEVGKIAAETMNNYLMFKKRVVAIYVPFEKRPSHLFLTRERPRMLPLKFRQARQRNSKNAEDVEEEVVERKNKAMLTKIYNKMEKLKKRAGVDFQIELVDNLEPSTS